MLVKKKKSVAVCGVEFKSAAALARHTRSVIESYQDGQMMSSEHAAFVFDLIARRHDKPDEKLIPERIGELVGIRVRHQSGCPQFGKSRTNRNHCLVVYADGTEIDFSWVGCCTGSFSPERDANHALRRAAEPHVREFKKRRFMAVGGNPTCDETGDALTWESCQVDHYPLTWAAMVDEFLAVEGIAIGDIPVVSVVPEGGCRLADQEFAERFERFHQARATLRLVSTAVNQRSWRDDGAIRRR